MQKRSEIKLYIKKISPAIRDSRVTKVSYVLWRHKSSHQVYFVKIFQVTNSRFFILFRFSIYLLRKYIENIFYLKFPSYAQVYQVGKEIVQI